jgi:hypothetical protein
MVVGTEAVADTVPDSLAYIEATTQASDDLAMDSSPWVNEEWEPGDVHFVLGSDCMECVRASYDLFDPALGTLKSVTIEFDGFLWGHPDPDAEIMYGNTEFGTWTQYNYYDIRDVPHPPIAKDDVPFEGVIHVPEASVIEFVASASSALAWSGFWDGAAEVWFFSEEMGEARAGATYQLTVRYGYEPVVAPVPLPPAALLMLGAFGALFATSRRRSGSGS